MVAISYDREDRMTVPELSCDCPCEHRTPEQDIYVGKALLGRLPGMIRRRGLGTRAMLLCDNNTYRAAGEAARGALAAAGFEVTLCLLARKPQVEPDEAAVGEALLALEPDTEMVISVGSGTLTDIARIVTTRTATPFVAVGTAPSMDGYTSVVAPLLLRGAKIHRQGKCPEIIVCDLDALRTAPVSMFVSGVGDVLGKYIAKADWAIANLINGEPFCPACARIALSAAGKVLEHIRGIKARTEEGTRALIEALLLSGLTVLIIGNTRAVASVEHNLAHYWEMAQLARGKKPPAHGASVGVATRYLWPLFERFAAQNLESLPRPAPLPDRREREAWMLHAFGPEAGGRIMAENPEDFLAEEERDRRAARAGERMGDIRAELALLPPFAEIEGALRSLGAPMTAGDLGIDDELLALSLRCAKDYRSRYTLLKTLDELGLLEEYLAGIRGG